MSSNIRLIDLFTIKKNPNAGKRDYTFPGKFYVQAEGNLKSIETIFPTTSAIVSSENKEDSTALLAVKPTLKELGECAKQKVRVTYTREMQRVSSITPEPSHFYEYLPFEVQCHMCEERFDYSELVAEVEPDGEGGEFYSTETCPKCGVLDCLVVSPPHETIGEALARKEKLFSPIQKI